MSKLITYIAHPISSDPAGNLIKLQGIYRELALQNEVVPFIPYVATVVALDDALPEERAIGFTHNEAIFRSGCIGQIYLYGDHISKGMAIEIGWARELNIPVIPKTEGTCKWEGVCKH